MSKSKCSIQGCIKNVHGKGLCGKHYQRLWKHGDPSYQATRYTICVVDGCQNNTRSSGSPYCEKHYGRIRRRGTTSKYIPTKKRQHKGGYLLVYRPDHSLTQRHTGSYEYEHRIIFYDKHGEGPFKCHWCKKEVSWDYMHIDHLNNKTDDNRHENLAASCPICNQQRGHHKATITIRDVHGRWIEHKGQRKMLSEWAKEIGITRASLAWRLGSGWTLDRALTETRGKYGPKVTSKTIRENGGYGR